LQAVAEYLKMEAAINIGERAKSREIEGTLQESTVVAGVGVERQAQCGIARKFESSPWRHVGP
jgi:hypothetical protein